MPLHGRPTPRRTASPAGQNRAQTCATLAQRCPTVPPLGACRPRKQSDQVRGPVACSLLYSSVGTGEHTLQRHNKEPADTLLISARTIPVSRRKQPLAAKCSTLHQSPYVSHGCSGSEDAISRILSRAPHGATGGNHLSRMTVARHLQRPTRRGTGEQPADGPQNGPSLLLSGLAPDGVYRGRPVTRSPVSSYLTISPLPAYGEPPAGGMFLWHSP